MPEQFVLVEEVATARMGRPIYFHMMTGIGPKGTDDKAEAAKFDTYESAMQCPAMHHSLSCYGVQQLTQEL